MYRIGNPYTLALLGVAALLFTLAAVTARSRHSRRVALPLAGFLGAVGLWAFGDGVRIAAPNEAHILLWNKVAYLGILSVPPTYFFFIAAITNRERWFRWRYVLGMIAISATACALALTNSWHHLWHTNKQFSPGTAPPVVTETHGILWFLWATYVGIVIGAGVYFLASDLVRSARSRLYRAQVGFVLVSVLVPWVVNYLYLFLDVVEFDPLPFVLPVTAVTFAVAIFRYDLLDITPIARNVVVENIESGVLVLDSGDTVVDANDRAREVLDIDAEAIPGAAVEEVVADAPDVAERLDGTGAETDIATVETGDGRRHYEVEVSPIEDDLGTSLGRAVVFTDVTDRIERELTLRERTAQLRRRNERLDELASVVSHDLRNPLDVTAQRAGHLRTVLDESDLSAEVRSTIEDELDGIERATERASEITGELLTITQDGDRSGGRAHSNPSDDAASESGTQGSTSLRRVATSAWDTVDTGDLELSIRGSRRVAADTGDLRRLFENCFRNAVEHGSTSPDSQARQDADGASSVEASVAGAPEDAGEHGAGATEVVVGATSEGFFVADDGTGLAGVDPERAFERGYSTAPDSEGLGLAIVAEVAESHGWKADLVEGEDGGARVEVAFDPAQSRSGSETPFGSSIIS